jgi:hypothetical protein
MDMDRAENEAHVLDSGMQSSLGQSRSCRVRPPIEDRWTCMQRTTTLGERHASFLIGVIC